MTYVPEDQVPTKETLDVLAQAVETLKGHQDSIFKDIYERSTAKPSLVRYALQHGDIDRWFEYHPPESDARKEAHKNIDEAAKGLTKCLMMYMPDEAYQLEFFQQIQYMRMMMNQMVTLMELDGISIPEVD